jgi:transposase
VCPARDQLFLLPVLMLEWVPADHLAHYVIAVVSEMDTRDLHDRPGGCAGRPPYQPEMMLAVLLYAYCCGIRSSRRIEAHCQTDAAFRMICGGIVPDHATIARFVVDHERALEDLFVDGVRLCAQAGLADLSVLALDGTKIAANASPFRNRNADWIREEITQLMAVTAQDQQRPAEPQGLPGLDQQVPELDSQTGRGARLEAALAVIETDIQTARQDAARATQAAAEHARQGRAATGRKRTRQPFAVLASAEIDHQHASQRLIEIESARAARRAAAARGEKLTAARPVRIDRARERLDRCEARLSAAHEQVQKATAAMRANITDPDSRIMTTPK